MDLFENWHTFAKKPALVLTGGQSLNYGELLLRIDDLASQIQTPGLVFNLVQNNVDSILGYLACLRARVPQLLLAAKIQDEALQNLLKSYNPRYVFQPVKGSRHIVERSEGSTAAYDKDLALLMSTSGCMGNPKAVRLSYKNVYSNASAIAKSLNIGPGERAITTMPMQHAYGLSVINSHLVSGAAIVTCEDSIVRPEFWRRLKETAATSLAGVPYTFMTLKKFRFADMDAPSLTGFTQAGGKLSAAVAEEFVDLCAKTGRRFYTMYGQTEATARITCMPWEYAKSKLGSAGLPLTGGKLWAEDEAGRPLGANSTGELVYQGDNVCLGYASSESDLCAGDVNKGVLRTGDLGFQDSDGFFTIVGRKKRILKVNGVRIDLDVLEESLRQDGFECACRGDDAGVEIFVVDKKIMERVKGRAQQISGLALISIKVQFVSEFPRSSAGKILYAALGGAGSGYG